MQARYVQAALATFNICWQMFKYIVYLGPSEGKPFLVLYMFPVLVKMSDNSAFQTFSISDIQHLYCKHYVSPTTKWVPKRGR